MPLRELSLSALPPTHGHIHDATDRYFEGGISDAELRSHLRRLSASLDIIAAGRVCLAFGYGSQTRSTYARLGCTDHINVLWDGSFVPWLLSPLALIAASHGGLVQVTHPARTRRVLLWLSRLAMVELYSFSSQHLDEVVHHVRRKRWRSCIGSIVGHDPTYFCFGVDGDSRECDSGLFAWLSFGAECPHSLHILEPQPGGLTKR